MVNHTPPQVEEARDCEGYVYCPPGWDESRLRSGTDAEAIRTVAMDTYTDIAYIKEKNAIQVIGETHEDVYKAQTKLNLLFFPVVVKSKRQWARPDRPGSWGQRRDCTPLMPLRRQKSESALKFNNNRGSGSDGASLDYSHRDKGGWTNPSSSQKNTSTTTINGYGGNYNNNPRSSVLQPFDYNNGHTTTFTKTQKKHTFNTFGYTPNNNNWN